MVPGVHGWSSVAPRVVALLAQGGNGTVVDRLWGEVQSTVPGPILKLVGAIAVLVAGWYLSKLAVRLSGRAVARRFERPSLTRTTLRSVRTLVIALSVLVALWVLGLRPGNILISVTVFSAVIGIVLAPIVGSVINGLFVLADQPYEIGDLIELPDAGHRGFVEDITIRYTKVFTLDNTFIVISNSSVRERDIVNYSAGDERIRLSLQILVTYEGDLAQAREQVERAARDVDEVIAGGPAIRIGSERYPAGPTCYIDQFADHGVLLNLRYWAKEPYRQLAVRSKVQTNVRDRLADADVEFAYPHQHHVFDETSGRARVGIEDGRVDHPTGGAAGSDHAMGGDPGDDGDGE
ncbi:mechanosensitive ion channel family protein [Halobacteriales archaeon QS_8_69_26]|nr:MAG: mechanosensitive ion channel family protein [Halobacteriales archaeon QS_8_69_26]